MTTSRDTPKKIVRSPRSVDVPYCNKGKEKESISKS